MPTKKTVPVVVPVTHPSVLAHPASESIPEATPATTATPTIPVALQPMAPPTVTIPAPPVGFVPVSLKDYQGFHPKAGQINAAPGAIQELNASTVYTTLLGPAAPAASDVAGKLTYASEWTAMRVASEALLAYAKSFEAVTWKAALLDVQQVAAIFEIVATQNRAALVAALPELTKLLEVPKVVGQRAHASRVRNLKAKGTAEATATTAATAPASTAPGGTGASVPGAPLATTASQTGGGGAH